MKSYRILFTGICLVLAGILLTSCNVADSIDGHNENVENTNYLASESFRMAVGYQGQLKFDISGINGRIEITAVPDLDSVFIRGEKRVESESLADAEDHLELIDITYLMNGDLISVRTNQPDDSNGRNYIVNYLIELPADMKVTVDHINGYVVASSLQQDFIASLVNGNIDVNDLAANLDIDMTNGIFRGDITLSEQGTCSIDIINGQIFLSIPGNTSAEFNAYVTNGLIGIDNLSLAEMHQTPNKVSGRLNDGSGAIDLGIINGTISVTGY